MKKYIVEFIGTFALIFLGSASYIIAGNSIGMIGVAMTYGLATAALYISLRRKDREIYLNPALALGALTAGRITALDALYTIITQLAASLAAGIAVYVMALGNLNYNLTYGLGQNGFGDQSLSGYNLTSAIIFELVATFLLAYIYLSSSLRKRNLRTGLTIGLFITGAYMAGMPIDGASLNPARSFGPGVIAGFSDSTALIQLLVFLLVPSAGAVLAALAYKVLSAQHDEEDYEEDATEEEGKEFGEKDEIEIIEE